MPQPKLSLLRRFILDATGCTALLRQYHAETIELTRRVSDTQSQLDSAHHTLTNYVSRNSQLEDELAEMTTQFETKCDELETIQAEFDEDKTSHHELLDKLREIIIEARSEIPPCDSIEMQCGVPRKIKIELQGNSFDINSLVGIANGLESISVDDLDTLEDALSTFSNESDCRTDEAYEMADDMRQACEDLRDIGYRRGRTLKELLKILGE